MKGNLGLWRGSVCDWEVGGKLGEGKMEGI